ncbi:MBL fold metallo-hydrolase [Natrinema soli]|uniref:MBL fold metallo-hydrolase n=1 Tax=Natrinema soli TaxID=1930624 RepID=A0ABD5SI30_9EURY|nr:MBL fold metallo-hydrolase [Natrinema soli]
MERILLANSAFEGDNNAYLFTDGSETVLVDTGDWMNATRTQLEAGLADHSVSMADVDRVFLTHWHPDHTGLAGRIQKESGAIVHVHEADAPLVETNEHAWEEMKAKQQALFEVWGMPDEDRAALTEEMSNALELDYAKPTVEPFVDGDTFSVNGNELRVVHTSGHADGLCIFEMELDGRHGVFSGDALLPKYTPNVGGADVRVERPLEKYLRALRHIADASYDRAWPGHRDPIDDPTARAEEIIHHHEERAWRVLDVLRRDGPSNPWAVSAALFGNLHGIHILHGPGEVYAHLEHLEREGFVEADGGKYQLTDDARSALDTSSEDRWPLNA